MNYNELNETMMSGRTGLTESTGDDRWKTWIRKAIDVLNTYKDDRRVKEGNWKKNADKGIRMAVKAGAGFSAVIQWIDDWKSATYGASPEDMNKLKALVKKELEV